MPIYDLFCAQCEHIEEVIAPINQEISNKCPVCDLSLIKKVGSVPVIFKGSGFYATEYGKSQANSYKKDKKEIQEREEFIEQAKKEMP